MADRKEREGKGKRKERKGRFFAKVNHILDLQSLTYEGASPSSGVPRHWYNRNGKGSMLGCQCSEHFLQRTEHEFQKIA